MADENDDLRSAIESAWDTTSAEPATAPPPAEPAAPEAAPASSDRPRDEHGRFAPKAAEPAQAAPADAAAAPPTQPATSPVTPDAASGTPQAEGQQGQAIKPPPGWSPTAKAEFERLPEAVKQAVVQREVEVNNGFAKLQEYKPIEPYVEWARSNGFGLDQVIERYRQADAMLAQNFEGGLMFLMQSYQRDPVQIAQWILQQAGAPAPRQQAQPGQPQPLQQDPFVRQMMERMSNFERWQQQQEMERQRQVMESVNTRIADFAAKPEARFLDNVADDMADLIRQGRAKSMEDAYEQACWLNPEIRQILINEERAKSQPPQPPSLPREGRSPPPGSPLGEMKAKPKPGEDVRSSIEAAWDELAGAI